MYNNNNYPYALGNPFAQPNPHRPIDLSTPDPDSTPPERIPVETSVFTYCGTCQKKIWTQVRKERGGLESNPLTDTFCRAICILFVEWDKVIKHYCPTCGTRFNIYRPVGHRSKFAGAQQQPVVNQQPGLYHQGMAMNAHGAPTELLASQYNGQQSEMLGSTGAGELERTEKPVELEDTEGVDERVKMNLPYPKDEEKKDESFVVARPTKAHVEDRGWLAPVAEPAVRQ